MAEVLLDGVRLSVASSNCMKSSAMPFPAPASRPQIADYPLEQTSVELKRDLDERQAELDAARAANRDLTRALKQRV
ncbi:hypothetical protein [Streptomyces sp. NPDC054787]